MSYIPPSDSVVAFQGNPSVLQVLATVTNPNQSVSGAVSISNLPVTQNVSGSVVAFGTVGASVIGHAPVVIVGGSVAASFTPPANQSVSGTVQAELLSSNASVITVGSPVANQSVSGEVSVSNFPVTQNVSGSVVAFQGTTEWTIKSSLAGGIFPISGSVAVGNFPTNQNVSGSVVAFVSGIPNVNTAGSVIAFQGGTWRTSVVSSTPSSMLVGASIIGLTPVSVSNFPTTQNVSGSVVAFVSGLQGSSVSGTLNVIQSGTLISSVSGVGGRSVTSSVYAVLSSITTVSILNANLSRIGATVYNNSGTPLFLKLGTAANTSTWTVKLNDTDYYEIPFGWGGVVAGITNSNAGVITVTELT